ncbi:MAG: hypothetical protein AAFY02_20320 [Pseudomonadota bacterium]
MQAAAPLDDLALPQDMAWSALRLDQVAEVEAMQARVYAGLEDHDHFKPAPQGFFASVVKGRGSVLTVRHGAAVVAFGTLLTGLAPGESIRQMVGLADGTPLAMMQGAVVDPAYRALHLHRQLLRRRLALLRPAGYWHVYASAAPGNIASWRNMLAEGYEVVALNTRYGRLLRYTVYRPAEPRFLSPEQAAALQWCDPDDVAGQERLLAEGARGVVSRTRGKRVEIGYTPGAPV